MNKYIKVSGVGWTSYTSDPKGLVAEPTGKLMYTPLESVFYSTMEREGRAVSVYTSGAEFQAFMRRNDDGNNFEDRITLFYSVNAPVVQGSIIGYGNKLYILVNRETEENQCYYKSSGLACNGMITLNDGTITGIPCYAYNIKDALVSEGQVVSMIDGNMEFITENNSLSRQLEINNTFNEFGRTWKINNIYYKDGILHVIAEVTTNEKPVEILNIIIDGLTQSSYSVGDTTKLTATLYQNNIGTSGTVTWTSNNNSVATVDGEGNVSFLADGTVVFTAYWVEKNYSKQTETIVVGDEPVITEYTATIQGNDKISVGFPRKYVAHLYDATETEVDGTWIFETSCNYPDLVTTQQNGNELEIITDDDRLLGEQMVITATETTTGTQAAKTVTFKSIF